MPYVTLLLYVFHTLLLQLRNKDSIYAINNFCRQAFLNRPNTSNVLLLSIAVVTSDVNHDNYRKRSVLKTN